MIYVALGDSITAARYGVVGYVAQIEQHLGKLGLHSVVNSGVGMLDTNGLLPHIHEKCLQHKPQIVTIMMGANDHVIDPNQTQPRVTARQYEENLREILDSILLTKHDTNFHNGYPQVILMTPPMIITCQRPNGADLNNGRLLRYCEVVRNISIDLNLPCVDVHSITASAAAWDAQIWTENFTHNHDGVHPNEKGQELIFTHVYKALQDAIHAD